jgi:predicted dithiol-disulfide oxidoreductase (DUF899 family)
MTPKIVSPNEWLDARVKLLVREKELTRLQDALAEERRQLPWVRVDKQYEFEGPDGKVSLSELFAGKSQLAIWHFMLGPGWKEGCPSCSMLSDHLNGVLPHLAARDVEYVAISRAPIAESGDFKARMGWRFHWVSSFDTEFNRDYHVSFTKDELAQGQFNYNYGLGGFPSEEAPGLSVFIRGDDGAIYHTYSTFARGAEPLLGAYALLDMLPKGRDEAGLPWPMAWVRHHDRYGKTTETSS